MQRKEDALELFWTIVVFAFVVGTLAFVGFAVARMFGAGHWRPQH